MYPLRNFYPRLQLSYVMLLIFLTEISGSSRTCHFSSFEIHSRTRFEIFSVLKVYIK
jgi:hypothetical protein